MSSPEPVLIEAASILLKLFELCPDADKGERAQISALWGIHRLLVAGWTSADIIAFMRWSEEFDPTIPEDMALRKMALVSSKYPRLGMAK